MARPLAASGLPRYAPTFTRPPHIWHTMRPYAALLLAPAAAACVHTNAAIPDPSVHYDRTCARGVQIFTSADKVGKDYREVALLDGMLDSQRQKAADLGANGIILNGVSEPNAGTEIIGGMLGTGAERKGAALAIHIPGDADAVKEICSGNTQVARSSAPPSSGSAPPPSDLTTEESEESGVYGYAPEGPQASPRAAAPTEVVPAVGSAPPPEAGGQVPVPAPRRTMANSRLPTAEERTQMLQRHTAMRIALGDVTRLGIVSEYQEAGPGVLVLALGDGYLRSASVEYNLLRLHRAYSEFLDYAVAAVIELWLNGRQIGAVTDDGMRVNGGL